jgi:hypothetical protein
MRGRVSDPFQPLRAAHIPNAPGFARGWLRRAQLVAPFDRFVVLTVREEVGCKDWRKPRLRIVV